MSATLARRLTIRGRVQGVGYRDAMIDAALHAGLAGWVRNRQDGSVEALVQGSREAVEAILDWASRGPPAARVTAVEASDAEVDPTLCGFALMPTA
jgi:acylphosphatase